MSKTKYLCFPDRASFEATLPAGFELRGETGAPLPEGVEALRIVGVMHAQVEDPEVIAQALPGWHVNVLGDLPLAWLPFEVFPKAPSGVFGA